MNKLMHGIVLAAFAFACWSVSIILKLPMMLVPGGDRPLLAFSRLCMGLGPMVWVGLTVLALAYCLVIWIRKTDKGASWVAFLATTMSIVVLWMLPTAIAIYLPIIDFLHRLPHN